MTANEITLQGSAKPVLVFLHYFGGAATSWKWLIEQLEQDWDCEALNLPGFGGSASLEDLSVESMAGFVSNYLTQHFSDKQYILVGHSMGGKIALETAFQLKSTGNLQRLILLAPSPPTVERMPEQEKQRMLIHPNRDEAITTVDNGTVRKLSDERLQTAIDTQLTADERTWKWWIKNGMNESIASHAKLIDVPVNLIVSSDDPAITEEMTKEETIPNLPANTTLTWTSGIGHLFQLEDPVWLANVIRQLV